MFPIAGQTAGPIGLTFFVDTHGWPGGVKGNKKKSKIFFKFFFFRKLFFSKFVFHGQRRALQLVNIKRERLITISYKTCTVQYDVIRLKIS